MTVKKLAFALSLLLLPPASVASAATLIVAGKLFGASDVDVNGTLYNVMFVDGTCIALFSGCDEASDFTFQTEADARAASQALGDQVFFNSQGPIGVPPIEFDTTPGLTAGCVITVGATCLRRTRCPPPMS